MENNMENITLFVGKNYAFYAKKWAMMAEKKKPMSWNWAAFFLGVVWLVYRKMYLYAAIFIAMIALDMYVEVFLGFALPESLERAATYAIAIMFGWYGNTLYKTYADKKIAQILATIPVEQQQAELAKQGGVNLIAAWTLGLSVLAVVGLVIWSLVMSAAAA